MKTFYIIIDSGVSFHYFNRLGGKYFADKGWNVKYIDTTSLTRKDSVNLFKYDMFSYKNTSIEIIRNFKEFRDSIQDCKNSIAILSLVYNRLNELILKKILRQRNVKFGTDKLGLKYCDFLTNMAVVPTKKWAIHRIYDSIITNGLLNTTYVIVSVFYQKFVCNDIDDFVLTICKDRLSKYEPLFLSYEYIECHSWEYDEYLSIEDKTAKDENYIVFIDQNIPHHPEVIENKLLVNWVDKYYHQLNSLFDNIEQKYKKRIIISPHPTSNIELLKEKFSGREVSLDGSKILTKNSSFVLSYSSGALNYAVIFNKQVIFITDDKFKKNIIGKATEEFSKSINQKLIDLSSVGYDIELEKIDNRAYRNYEKNNITKCSKNLNKNWDIFYDNYIK